MRLRLVGYSGERPPTPSTLPVVPVDPAPESQTPPDPMVLTLADGDVFHKVDYLALGYNRFEVTAFGAAGGSSPGSGVVQSVRQYPTQIRRHKYNQSINLVLYTFVSIDIPPTAGTFPLTKSTYPAIGGAGGGGGIHRLKGRLALLPTAVPVVVGTAGADGAANQNGNDGGYSSFGEIVKASGGKGGLLSGVGGAGGAGNSIVAGGNASGDGSWDGSIGSGGKGGSRNSTDGYKGAVSTTDPSFAASGQDHTSVVLTQQLVEIYQAEQISASENGPIGSYGFIIPLPLGGVTNPNDPDLWLGASAALETNSLWDWILYTRQSNEGSSVVYLPGSGGGAKVLPITGEDVQYGSKVPGSHPDGGVLIRLSYAVT